MRREELVSLFAGGKRGQFRTLARRFAVQMGKDIWSSWRTALCHCTCILCVAVSLYIG